MIEISSLDKFNSIINEDLSLVNFYADWNGSCKALEEVLRESEASYPNICFARINTDMFQILTRKYNAMSLPTLILFSKGVVVKQKAGLLLRDELDDFLK